MRFTPRIDFVPKIDVPDGFVMIQDTREQKPLFSKPRSWIINTKLDEGDYSIKGFEKVVVIERKSLNDFYNSLGNDRERFEKELERLQGYKWKGLVVESPYQDVFIRLVDYSKLHPNSLYHSIASLECKHFLHVFYAPTRKDARWWVLSRLVKLYKYLREGKL